MAKPKNRFELVVEKALQQYQELDDFLTDNRILKADDVIKLLRQEHAATVRMVKGLLRQTMVGRKKYPDAVIFIGQQSVLEAVLFKLAKRKG